jgi:hypothetical protein
MDAKLMDLNGCRLLMSAIIEQAVADLRALENTGHLVVVGGFLEINLKSKFKRNCSAGYRAPSEIVALLHFFQGPLESAIRLAGLNISADTIRNKLKIKPSENYAA